MDVNAAGNTLPLENRHPTSFLDKFPQEASMILNIPTSFYQLPCRSSQPLFDVLSPHRPTLHACSSALRDHCVFSHLIKAALISIISNLAWIGTLIAMSNSQD